MCLPAQAVDANLLAEFVSCPGELCPPGCAPVMLRCAYALLQADADMLRSAPPSIGALGEGGQK